MGGQTALNLTMEAEKKGILKKYHICFEDSAKAAKFVKNNYLNLAFH